MVHPHESVNRVGDGEVVILCVMSEVGISSELFVDSGVSWSPPSVKLLVTFSIVITIQEPLSC